MSGRGLKHGRYYAEFGGAMALYSASVVVSTALNNRLALEGWAAIGVGMLPMIPALLALWAFLRQFWRMDELQRRVVSEAVVIAAGVVGFISFGAGWALAAVRPDHPGFYFLPLLMVLPAMILVWGVAMAFVARRYR